MFRQTVFILILSYLASNLLRLDALSVVSLVHRKPLVESNQTDHDSDCYITQRLDNFDHQNPRTFQMVFEQTFEFHRNIINFIDLIAAIFQI